MQPSAPYPLTALALLVFPHFQLALGQIPAADSDAARQIPATSPIVKIAPLTITRQVTVAKTPAAPIQDPAVHGVWDKPSAPPDQPNLRDEGDVDATLQQDLQTSPSAPPRFTLLPSPRAARPCWSSTLCW